MRYTGENIQWTLHAEEYIERRGFVKEEVEEAITKEPWILNPRGKFECRRDFVFERIWNNTYYSTKQVRPIFVKENDVVTVITVYTYYF